MIDLDAHRDRQVGRARAILKRFHYPRASMTLMVSLTAASGFFASMVLLHAGVHSMAVRYPLAVGVAYGAFLLLLGFWLRSRQSDWTRSLDLPDPSGSGGRGGDGFSALDVPSLDGAGGASGGGGASGSFDNVLVSDGPSVDVLDVASVADAEEGCLIVVLVAVLAAAAIGAFWMIWIAPTLLAELMVDAAIAAGLYRRVRGIERESWVWTAIRRTAVYFLLVAAIFGTAGWAMQRQVPGASSIGAIFESVRGETP